MQLQFSSINEIQQKQLLQLQQQLQHQNQLLQHSKRHSSSSTHKQDTNMKGSLQNLINIDDIPVNGKALALSTRPGNKIGNLTLKIESNFYCY